MNILTTLSAPLSTARTIAGAGAQPWRLWFGLAAIAIFGSLLVGASIGLVTGSALGGHAIWFTASAGISWCIFGPALKLATRLGWLFLAHACLVAMAHGELVLALATITNTTIHLADLTPTLAPTAAIVLAANLTMAASLALQLRTAGAPLWLTLALWFLLLDGAGAALFYFLAP